MAARAQVTCLHRDDNTAVFCAQPTSLAIPRAALLALRVVQSVVFVQVVFALAAAVEARAARPLLLGLPAFAPAPLSALGWAGVLIAYLVLRAYVGACVDAEYVVLTRGQGVVLTARPLALLPARVAVADVLAAAAAPASRAVTVLPAPLLRGCVLAEAFARAGVVFTLVFVAVAGAAPPQTLPASLRMRGDTAADVASAGAGAGAGAGAAPPARSYVAFSRTLPSLSGLQPVWRLAREWGLAGPDAATAPAAPAAPKAAAPAEAAAPGPRRRGVGVA